MFDLIASGNATQTMRARQARLKVNLSMDRRYCQMEEKSSPLQEVKPLANGTTLVKGEKIKDKKIFLSTYHSKENRTFRSGSLLVWFRSWTGRMSRLLP
jgi:hypothetical protein